MAFFPSSSGLIINDGNFTSFNFQTEDGPTTTDGLMILKAGDVELRRELISDSDNSYRIHAASHGGRLVAFKAFEGSRAKQDWKVNVAFSKKCLHPNVLQIVGISDESSKSHFIQFHGITSEQKMQWLIANALGTDLNTSVQLSMKAVKGIAAGLSYIKSQNIPVMPGTMNNNQKWDNFDILTGYDNEPIIAFHLSSTICEDGSVSQNLDIKTDSRGVEVLNGLCEQLFSGANSILYDDSPEREFDVYDSEGLPAATLEHEESTSNLYESEAMSNRSNPKENPKPSRKPRREVWWLDLGATNHSLKSIGRCFEDRLNWSLLSSSNSLLRRIRSSKDDNLRRNLHQCPGYLREEITLTCDLSKSVVVSHAFPGQSERCSICYQLVQYTYSESFDYNNIISYYPPTPHNPLSLPLAPTEGAPTFDNFAPVGGIGPFTPNIGAKSSDASSVMRKLFQPSLPFNEDIQSMQSMTDPNMYQDTGFQWMQFRQNLGVDFGSGQTPSSSTLFPDYMDAANQQTQQQQQPATHFFASSVANNNQATLPLQLNKIGRMGSLTFGKNAEWDPYGMIGGDESHQNSLPPVDETRPAVSFPSRNHARSSSTGSRSMCDSSPVREQQLPTQESRDLKKINKKEAERLHREAEQEKRKLVERKHREQARDVLRKRQQLTRETVHDDIEWLGVNNEQHGDIRPKGKQPASGILRHFYGTADNAALSATANAAVGKSGGPQQEHLSRDWDRERNWQGVERGAKTRRREFDDDHSMSSSEVHSISRMSSISFATVDSDPGPPRLRNHPSLYGISRVTSKSSLRTSFDDFLPSAYSSNSYSLDGQLAHHFGTQASVSSHISGSVSPPQLQMMSLSPTMSPPLSPSSPWLQVQHHKEDLLSPTRSFPYLSVSPSSTPGDPSESPLDLNAQLPLPLPPPPPNPYAHRPRTYGYPPSSGRTPKSAKSGINPIFKVGSYKWDSTDGLIPDDSIQPALPPLPLPPIPPSLETHLLSLNTLPPFSELEAVAGGEYNALSR